MIRTIRKITRGAFGEIYLARYHHQEVALKKIEYRKANLVEISLMSGFHHPSLNFGLHISLQSNYFYLTQPLAVSDLHHEIKYKYVPFERRIKGIQEITQGILYLHSIGIIHMDIKPSNILVYHQEGEYQWKITDFGVSTFNQRVLEGKVGTRTHLPPEAWDDQFPVTPQVDYWSLGCTLHFIIYQKYLFLPQENTPGNIIKDSDFKYLRAIRYFFNPTHKIKGDFRKPVIKYLDRKYLQDWSRIIRSLLRRDPSDREIEPLLEKLELVKTYPSVLSPEDIYQDILDRYSKVKKIAPADLSRRDRTIIEWISKKFYYFSARKPDLPLYDLMLRERDILKSLDYYVV